MGARRERFLPTRRFWGTRRSVDPFKKALKTDDKSTCSLFGTTKPAHVCIILAISPLQSYFSSFCSLFASFFTQKLPRLAQLFVVLEYSSLPRPFKNYCKTNVKSTFSLLGTTKPAHVRMHHTYLPSHLYNRTFPRFAIFLLPFSPKSCSGLLSRSLS